MTYFHTHPAPAGFPDARPTSSRDQKTCPASYVPPVDAGSFEQPKRGWPCVPAEIAEPTRVAITVGSPTDAARGFSRLKARVSDLQRQADTLRGKAGYRIKLDRLRLARSALLDAENKLNRK